MQLSEMLVREVQTAAPTTPLLEIARLMRDTNIGFVPIVENQTLIGVVTDRDIIVRAVAESKDAERTPVCDVMSYEVVCCFDDESTEHARELMDAHDVRRLPVINREHRLVGVINMMDLEGREATRKKTMKVTFHKEKTDSYGRPHKVAIKTIYVTGLKSADEARDAAVKRLEQETGGAWTNVANTVEAKEDPGGSRS